MADYRRIVEEIQELLAMDAYPAANRLETLLGEHFEAIKEVNHRLRECDRLLQKGHRTEAIQRCEVEPNLLDVVNMLDFPERAEWAAYLKEIDLAAPPDLLVDVAADLNQAYVLEQPLTSLLRSHRLHALAGSPLRPRIELLRKIAQLDHNSSIWQEDLRDYETVRQRQLQGEVDAALQGRDVRSLALLEVEIRSPQWLASPPKALVERVVQVHAEVRAFCVRQELVALEPKLTAAYNALDVQAGRVLREQWKARASVGITRQNDPLLELVAPSLDWLADEDRRDEDDASFNEAIVQLEQGLDGNAGREVLEKLYYNVTRFDREVPETLSQRLTERIRSLDTAARRKKTTLTLTAIAATVLILGGMAAWFSYQMRQASIVQTHQATLEQLVAEGKLEQAEKHAEQLKAEEPAVYSHPDLGKVLGDLGDALATEANRKQLLDQGTASARALIEKKTPEAVQQARRDLKAIVLPLLKTDEEKLAHQELDRGAREIERGHQLERDKEFEQELNVLKERLDKASSDDRDLLEDLLRALNALSGQTGISPGVQSRVAPLLKKAQGMIDSIALRSGEEKALQQITLRLDSRDRYLLALKEYVEKAPPQNSRAADFDRVLKQDADAWKGLEQWDALAKRWAALNLNEVDPGQAKTLLEDSRTLFMSYAKFPGSEQVKGVMPRLLAVSERIDENGDRIDGQLLSLLSETALGIPFMVQAKNIHYYTDREPTLKGEQWTVHYFTDGTLSVRNKRDISEIDIANARSGRSYDWQSPQERFREEARDLLRKLNHSNWERTFCKLLYSTTKYPELDAVLRFQLATKILEIGCKGSYYMQTAFERERTELSRSDIDTNANWVSPDDADGDRARREAGSLLKDMTFVDSGKKALMNLQMHSNKPVELPRYAWIGWVYRDASRKWTCSVRNAPATSEPLFVLEPKSPGEIVMTPIGQLTNGRPSVEPTSTEALVEGRPVFIATDK